MLSLAVLELPYIKGFVMHSIAYPFAFNLPTPYCPSLRGILVFNTAAVAYKHYFRDIQIAWLTFLRSATDNSVSLALYELINILNQLGVGRILLLGGGACMVVGLMMLGLMVILEMVIRWQ